jgi:hypothetical protein
MFDCPKHRKIKNFGSGSAEAFVVNESDAISTIVANFIIITSN